MYELVTKQLIDGIPNPDPDPLKAQANIFLRALDSTFPVANREEVTSAALYRMLMEAGAKNEVIEQVFVPEYIRWQYRNTKPNPPREPMYHRKFGKNTHPGRNPANKS